MPARYYSNMEPDEYYPPVDQNQDNQVTGPNYNIPSSDYMSGQKFDAETIKWQLSSSDFIEELEHDLKGELPQSDGTWKQVDEPLMNDMGIRTVRSILRTHANKVIFLSKLKEDRILQFSKEMNHVIVDLLFLNYQKWGVKKENCTLIVRKVCHFVFAAMMRAEGEGERKFLGETRSVRELVSNVLPNRQNRGLSIFGRRGQ